MGSNPPPYNRYRAVLETRLPDSAMVQVTARGLPGDGGLRVEAEVRIAAEGRLDDPGAYTIRLLVLENQVDAGAYGLFDHVVRDLVLEEPLTAGEPGAISTYSESVTLDPAWKTGDLKIAAWVQQGSDGEVMNATVVALGDPVPVQTVTWGRVKSAFRQIEVQPR